MTIDPTHPVIRWRAGTFAPSHDLRESIERQLGEIDQLVVELANLEPGAPDALALLQQLVGVLVAVTTDAGPVHGFTIPMQWLAYRESMRLLPPEQQFNRPGTTEQPA